MASTLGGNVVWDPVKSLWFISMFLGWTIGGALFFSWGAFAAFLLLSGLILCGGHSIGMHRKLIHDSFHCHKNLERFGAYLGTLVGLGGPFTIMQTHDVRDWAQRQSECHDFMSHKSPMIKDFWWQIHCKLEFEIPLQYHYPEKLTDDPFMVWLQRTSMVQQIPVAVLLCEVGGWGFVFWGICGRVWISIFGHWLVGYFAHNRGHQDWLVKGAAVQGHNVKWCGLITFGECWHNNHHAFPESAKLGLYAGQVDPGWWVLRLLERCGWVSGLVTNEDIKERPELVPVE